MTRPLIIIGCGGFGREVWAIVEALRAAGETWAVEGFADDAPSQHDLNLLQALGSGVVSSVAVLAARETSYSAVIAVGAPSARRSIHAALAASPVDYPRLIHPDSTIGPSTVLGVGVVIAPGARLSTNITVGNHVHIDQNATVGHDTTLGDFARLNPQACVSGSVSIGSGSTVGASATILQGLSVGAGATVGAAACVVVDVAEGRVVKGVPAR